LTLCFTLNVTSKLAHLLTRSVPLVSDLVSCRELVRRLLGRFRQLDQLVGPNTSYISTYKHIEGHILVQAELVTVGCLFFLECDCWVTELVINQYKRPIFKNPNGLPRFQRSGSFGFLKKEKSIRRTQLIFYPGWSIGAIFYS
jgi:hypothetical protein